MGEIINLIKQIQPYLSIGLLILSVVLIIWIIFLQLSLSKIKKKNKDLFGGSKINNLEELITQHTKSLKILDKDIHELYNISNQINNLSFRGLHKTGIVRFNPFKDVGGDQSFAIAMLNGKNNGLVLSSLFTREGTRIYAKAITKGESEKYPLTEEEEQAIKIALMTSSTKQIS